MNNKITDDIFEKKKQENDKRIITKRENLKIFTSSIFFPIQINKKLQQWVTPLLVVYLSMMLVIDFL